MKLRNLALLVLSVFVLTACGGGGGDGDDSSSGDECTKIGDASFKGGSFEAYDDALSYVYRIDFDFSGTTLTFADVGTDSPSDSEDFLNVSFNNNRTATVEGIEFSRSCNDEYLIYGINDVDDKFVGFGVKNELTNGSNALADGEYSFIEIADDERNTGSFVFTDVFDITFNGDGTGFDQSGDFLYNITDVGIVTINGEPYELGQINADGSVITMQAYNDTDEFVHLSVLIKKSSDNQDSTLIGVYNYAEIDGDDDGGSTDVADLTSSYGTLNFNGDGTCAVTDTVDGSFTCTYNVSDDGTITFNDGSNTFIGALSSDENLVTLARDESDNAGPFFIIATKR